REWYRTGCDSLLKTKKADGSWEGDPGNRTQFDHWPIVATSFALLFLAEGRTPVLVTKWAHDEGDERNNKRSDVRNLVAFTSRELFKGQPLAWQAFDVRRQPLNSIKEMVARAAELRESPVVFLNGHRLSVPLREGVVLKRYLEVDGFLFAEACCGSKDFDCDFRALMKQAFPDDALKELPADHPLWKASGKIVSQ